MGHFHVLISRMLSWEIYRYSPMLTPPILHVYTFLGKNANILTQDFIMRFKLQMALQKQQKMRTTHNPHNVPV